MIYELHKPSAETPHISLVHTYQVGSDSIVVYRNGVRQILGTHYIESSSAQIAFHILLTDSDVVVVQFQHPISIKPLQQYGSTIRLLPNNEYTFNMSFPLFSAKYSFTSRYDPLYSSVKIIRNDLGKWLEDISDENINLMIHTTSLTANEILGDEIPNPLPNYVKQYTRYKTQVALIKNVYLENIKNHKNLKTLGNLTIDNQSRMPDLEDLLRSINSDLAPWEAMMFGGNYKITPRSATKSRMLEDYPLAHRRSF